jgi:predicted nuclease of predicted toxin-antitoxin system
MGHSVEFPPASQLGKIDVLQLIYATKIDAILLTRDKDFSNKRFPPLRIQESPGVVVFRTSDPTDKQYERLVKKLLRHLRRHNIHGRLCIASVGGIQVVRVED